MACVYLFIVSSGVTVEAWGRRHLITTITTQLAGTENLRPHVVAATGGQAARTTIIRTITIMALQRRLIITQEEAGILHDWVNQRCSWKMQENWSTLETGR